MKLTPPVCLLLIFLLAAPSFADSKRTSLEELFATTYKHNEEINSEWVLSRERNWAAWQRMRAVREAANRGEDLSYLSKYGLERKSAWYEIDLGKQRAWLTSFRLLGVLSSWYMLKTNQEELYELGMTVAEVEKLGRYVIANDIKEINIQARLDYFHKEEAGYIGRILQGGEDFAAIYLELQGNLEALEHLLETNWIIDLFSKFDSEAQEILLTYSLSKYNSREGMGRSSYSLDQEAEMFVDKFLSGEINAMTKEALERLQEKRLAKKAKVNVEFKPPVDSPVNECKCPPDQCSYNNS
ncbi:hypothetical protein [Microbulbifer sp. ANSA005]|uniref:hypothetical protein n=1 Tax=Microbulbifer sp. ANSA005 TaxID=3243362 RepID=UPI004041AA4F